MADTRKLTMVFNLDNGDEFKYNLTDPKDALTKTEVDEAMQAMIDNNAVLKDGHGAASIKEAYITTTTQTVLD
ncbi:DUF2922 domain-containing protein [Megamonas hypermegale]|uniref:DUF2922 domain-containing protein n=1 Tax=Megamonas hypermegale TaxID=158847 RepID=UPI0026F2C098|nr:DUF2922 domain-containing protein [Megamonas hypermegale]